MDKKSINELRRRLKKDTCTFTKLVGCYVDDNKNKVTYIDETFLNLEDEEFFKFLEIGKKVLSTNVGNNILSLDFPNREEMIGGHQHFLMGLKKSGLEDKGLVDTFFDMIIDKYDSLGNYLILLFHDRYDVMTKTNDNISLDESEEVYEYIICAICPMVLTKPGLGYDKEENKIGRLRREWIVCMPETGFVFPNFVDRSTDIHSLLLYTADPSNPHTEFVNEVLGCNKKMTKAQKQDALTEMIFEGADEEYAKDVLETVHIELAQVAQEVEEETYTTKEHISDALESAGVPKNRAERIGSEYIESLKDEIPYIEEIVSNKAAKIVKENNEKAFLKEEIKELNRRLTEITNPSESDIVIKVANNKKDQIRTETINGQKCVVIPVFEDEKIKIN